MPVALYALTVGAFGIGITELTALNHDIFFGGGVVVATGLVAEDKRASAIFIGLLGAAGFATVAPLQMWLLSKAVSAGHSLASNINIGAFNLGNAIGAWASKSASLTPSCNPIS